jgi:hypothetical protein
MRDFEVLSAVTVRSTVFSVVLYIVTNLSDEPAASIIRVGE